MSKDIFTQKEWEAMCALSVESPHLSGLREQIKRLESKWGYAEITGSYPLRARLTPEGKEVYEEVVRAKEQSRLSLGDVLKYVEIAHVSLILQDQGRKPNRKYHGCTLIPSKETPFDGLCHDESDPFPFPDGRGVLEDHPEVLEELQNRAIRALPPEIIKKIKALP